MTNISLKRTLQLIVILGSTILLSCNNAAFDGRAEKNHERSDTSAANANPGNPDGTNDPKITAGNPSNGENRDSGDDGETKNTMDASGSSGSSGDSDAAGVGGGADEAKDGAELGIEEATLLEELLDLEFRRFPDNAAWTNCVHLKINKQPEIEVGCNKDLKNRVTKLKVLRKPHCNVIGIRLYSNGGLNITTANAGMIRVANNGAEDLAHFKGIKLYRESPNVLLGLVNDNGDQQNHSDTTFKLVGLDKINFRIENSGQGCN